MATARNRFERVHSSLSRYELNDLDDVVATDGLTRSAVIRVALLEYLKRRAKRRSVSSLRQKKGRLP